MGLLVDLLVCLRFFSRLPIPTTRRELRSGPRGLLGAAVVVPIAGAIIGVVPALTLLVATAIGLPPLVAAPLALAVLVAVTGALHEDGLADCADGFGGGRSRAAKLEIMRDSRIGTFGACAVAVSLYVRAAAITTIAMRAPGLAATVVGVAAALSRSACLLPLVLLPPARADGLGAAAGRPSRTRFAVALAVTAAIGIVPFAASPLRSVVAIAFAFAGALLVCGIAWRQIGGQTGDVAGAAQQVAEIACLLVFAAQTPG